uniref:Ig-like domain-containing protein n=1 Tax=Oreochromis aureus TaxID=47969 RepID=A0A668VYE2_OREAU
KVRILITIIFVSHVLFKLTADTLDQVTTVQLGEPVTLTCVLPPGDLTSKIHWYKQRAGETLKLIATLRQTTQPQYGQGFNVSRFEVKDNKNISSLTIFRTIPEDEGMYHCAVMEWNVNTWSATYLLLKGNTQRNVTVRQWPTVLDPVRAGDSVTLNCSVLSDSDNKMCPGDLNVLWFRGQNSHPNIIYVDGKNQTECKKQSDTQKSCIYRFSKNLSSSDVGTYYCAVVTCGTILFGDGTQLQIGNTKVQMRITLMTYFFLFFRRNRLGSHCAGNSNNLPGHFKQDLNYAAIHFPGRKATKGSNKREQKTEECVYSQVKR